MFSDSLATRKHEFERVNKHQSGCQVTAEPLASIIIAAYNAATTIAETLQSLIQQSYETLEIIVCDDASTDGTSEVVLGINDARIVLLRNESNLGPGLSRDRAIEIAAGEWLAIVDADDICHPERIARLIAAARGDKSVIVFDNTVECHHTANGLAPWRPVRKDLSFGAKDRNAVNVSVAEWLSSNKLLMHPLIPSIVVRSHGIRHSAIRFAEDSEFILKLVAAGATLRYLPEALYFYRITPGSLTVNRDRWKVAAEVFRGSMPLFMGDTKTSAALEIAAAKNEFYDRQQQLVMNIRAGHWVRAVAQVAGEPSLVVELVRRLGRDVAYNLDRLAGGGLKR